MKAEEIESWERCPQKFLYEQEWEPFEATAVSLAKRALLESLTSGESSKDILMRLASRYNLPATIQDPYASVQHYGSLVEVIQKHVELTLGPLKAAPETSWKTDALLDTSGKAHHFLLVDRWGDDRARAESHSWKTLGDLIRLEYPLYWNVYVLGPAKDGKRYGNWSRGFSHPRSKELRFQVKTGGEGKWNLTWRERTQIHPQEWLKKMSADNVLSQSVFRLKVPISRDDVRLQEAAADLVRIEAQMISAKPEKRRSACDGIHPCPFQLACWDKDQRPIEKIGAYRRIRYKGAGEAAAGNCTSSPLEREAEESEFLLEEE